MNDTLRELVFEAHRQTEKKTYGWIRNPEELRQKFAEVIIFDILNELTNDESLGPARIESIARLAERYGVKNESTN
jgi:regulator of RNase E activity RraB